MTQGVCIGPKIPHRIGVKAFPIIEPNRREKDRERCCCFVFVLVFFASTKLRLFWCPLCSSVKILFGYNVKKRVDRSVSVIQSHHHGAVFFFFEALNFSNGDKWRVIGRRRVTTEEK